MISPAKSRARFLSAHKHLERLRAWPLLALTVLALAAAFGGSSRADVLSLLVLRPISILLLIWAVLVCGRSAFQKAPGLVWLSLATVLIVSFHLVPLPAQIWAGLPLREIVALTYQDLGVDLPWLPLTLSPARGWNALFFLTLPLAAMFAALCLDASGLRKLAVAVIAVMVGSGLIGLLQVVGPPGGALYFYRITNEGAAVGLFANRNHNGLFAAMAIPLLAAFWRRHTPELDRKRLLRQTLLSALGLIAVSMALLTGSRGALLVLTLGVAGAIWIGWTGRNQRTLNHEKGRRGENGRLLPTMMFVGFAGAAFVAIALIALQRSDGLERLVATDSAQEMRLLALPVIWGGVTSLWPFGGGAGSFETVYKHLEPIELLGPQYLNHAHNDWIEVLFEFGIAGAILILAGLAMYVVAVRQLFRANPKSKTHTLAQAGAVMLLMVGTLSIFDYPARVPLMAVCAMFSAVWLAHGGRSRVG